MLPYLKISGLLQPEENLKNLAMLERRAARVKTAHELVMGLRVCLDVSLNSSAKVCGVFKKCIFFKFRILPCSFSYTFLQLFVYFLAVIRILPCSYSYTSLQLFVYFLAVIRILPCSYSYASLQLFVYFLAVIRIVPCSYVHLLQGGTGCSKIRTVILSHTQEV
jgi:hypothetical protein